MDCVRRFFSMFLQLPSEKTEKNVTIFCYREREAVLKPHEKKTFKTKLPLSAIINGVATIIGTPKAKQIDPRLIRSYYHLPNRESWKKCYDVLFDLEPTNF